MNRRFLSDPLHVITLIRLLESSSPWTSSASSCHRERLESCLALRKIDECRASGTPLDGLRVSHSWFSAQQKFEEKNKLQNRFCVEILNFGLQFVAKFLSKTNPTFTLVFNEKTNENMICKIPLIAESLIEFEKCCLGTYSCLLLYSLSASVFVARVKSRSQTIN